MPSCPGREGAGLSTDGVQEARAGKPPFPSPAQRGRVGWGCINKNNPLADFPLRRLTAIAIANAALPSAVAQPTAVRPPTRIEGFNEPATVPLPPPLISAEWKHEMLCFYVTFDDPDLIDAATRSAGNNPVLVHGRHNLRLEQHYMRTGTLSIVAHGGFNSGSLIGGMVDGARLTLTAAELAEQISTDDLPRGWGDIRLIVCWGGYVGGTVENWTVAGLGTATLKREAGEAPFAGQLCSALKAEGYYRMIVTGYRGAVTSATNVVNSDGKDGAADRQEPDGDPPTRRLSDALHGAGPKLTLDAAPPSEQTGTAVYCGELTCTGEVGHRPHGRVRGTHRQEVVHDRRQLIDRGQQSQVAIIEDVQPGIRDKPRHDPRIHRRHYRIVSARQHQSRLPDE